MRPCSSHRSAYATLIQATTAGCTVDFGVPRHNGPLNNAGCKTENGRIRRRHLGWACVPPWHRRLPSTARDHPRDRTLTRLALPCGSRAPGTGEANQRVTSGREEPPLAGRRGLPGGAVRPWPPRREPRGKLLGHRLTAHNSQPLGGRRPAQPHVHQLRRLRHLVPHRDPTQHDLFLLNPGGRPGHVKRVHKRIPAQLDDRDRMLGGLHAARLGRNPDPDRMRPGR